jgi:phenylpropionate dioxygenase-like ring-hydroxylating dioxygenase large terminal subunit
MSAVVREDAIRWARKFPWLGTGPVKTDVCISPELFKEEVEKVYKNVWLCVGRVEDVPEPGSYLLRQLHFASTAALVVRGRDHRVRAFHNTCSHRGNTVVVPQDYLTFGKGRVLSCRFHGWAYNPEGQLQSVPEEERFHACFDKKQNGLTPMHCDTWEGFVFVNLAEKPAQPLREFLGKMGDHFSGFPYTELTRRFRYYTYLNCNWKVGLDAFAEAYHVNTIHAGSFPGTFSTGLQMVELYGDHRTTAVCFNPPKNTPPVLKLMAAKARGSLTNNLGTTSMLPPTLNYEKRSDYAFELSVFFPNWLLHVAEGIWFTHQFWPVSHARCLWEGNYHVREPRTHSERWALEQAMVLQRNAWLEDTATMEGTHSSLESGAKPVMQLQDDEVLVRHGYHVLDKYLGRA